MGTPTTGRTTAKGTKPKNKKATSAANWKSNSRHPVLLTLPSGNSCYAINRGLKMFRDKGMIPNALLPIVNKALNEGQGINPKTQADQVLSVDMLPEILAFADSIVVSCVVDPDIQAAPTAQVYDESVEAALVVLDTDTCEQPPLKTVVVEEDEQITDVVTGQVVSRDPDVLYVDECDLDDKMFVMDWALGGTKELELFRKQSAAAMADLQGGGSVEPAPE